MRIMLNEEAKMRERPILRILAFFVCNILAMLLIMHLCPPYWETNDDFDLAGLASGVFGQPTARILNSNVLLGLILRAAYAFLPQIHWFGLILLLLICLSYTAIVWLLTERQGLYAGGIGWLAMIATLYYFCVTINYTRVALLACMAGWLLILHGIQKMHGLSVWAGNFLMLAGSLLRRAPWPEATALAAAVAAGQVLTRIFRKDALKGKVRARGRYLIFALTGIVLVAVAFLADLAVYSIDEDWRAYRDYNSARVALLDYGVPEYEDNKEAYAALGLTANDREMLHDWSIADPERFDTDMLRSVADIRTTPHEAVYLLDDARQAFAVMVSNKAFLYALCLILLVLAFCAGHVLIPIGLAGFAAWAMLFYLYYVSRHPARVTEPLGVTFALCVLFCVERQDFPHTVPISKMKIALAALLIPFLIEGAKWTNPENYEERVAVQTDLRQEISEKTSAENLYLCDAFYGIPFDKLYGTFEAADYGLQENFYQLGSWTTACPITNDILQNYNVANPFRALYESDNVFLIDSENIQTKITYIREHYYVDVNWSVYNTLGDSYIVAVTDNTIKRGEDAAVCLTLTYTGKAENNANYANYVGTLDAAQGSLDTEKVWCLLMIDDEGKTKAFRFDLEEGENGYTFVVGIPDAELPAGIYTVVATCRDVGASAYDWQTYGVTIETQGVE